MKTRILTAVLLCAGLAVWLMARSAASDPCASYVDVSTVGGHIVTSYPDDLTTPCGGGIYDGGYAVIGVSR
jgi:hypothetical protein